MALILVNAHMLFTKPMTKRAGAKQSYLKEERAKKTSNPTTQTDADFKYMCYFRALNNYY